MIVDKVNADNSLALNCPVDISEKLTLSSGRVVTSASNILSISNPLPDGANNGVAVADYDNNPGYVDGPMRRKVQNTTSEASYLFPVGKLDVGTHYYKRFKFDTVTNAATPVDFEGEYFHDAAPGIGVGGTLLFQSILHGIRNNEYWDINPISGTPKARIILPYFDPGPLNWIDLYEDPIYPPANSNVAIVHGSHVVNKDYNYEFTEPDSTTFNNGPPTPQAMHYLIAGDISSRLTDKFSPFTFGWGYNTVLPLRLLAFSVSLHHEDAHLVWSIEETGELRHFEVEHSTNGREYKVLAKLGPNGGSQYFYRHLKLMPGVHYYRLTLVDKNGIRVRSKTEILMVNTHQTIIAGLLHNPVTGGRAMLRVYSATNQNADVMLYDMAGRALIKQKINLFTGYNQPPISVSPLPSGIYKLKIRTQDGVEKIITLQK